MKMNLKKEKTYCDSIRRKIVHLRRSVEKFLSQTGMAPTRFGRDAARDPRLVFDLRNGREPGDRVKRRVEHFMNIYGQEKQRRSGRARGNLTGVLLLLCWIW